MKVRERQTDKQTGNAAAYSLFVSQFYFIVRKTIGFLCFCAYADHLKVMEQIKVPLFYFIFIFVFVLKYKVFPGK